jgi:hypothetical protein
MSLRQPPPRARSQRFKCNELTNVAHYNLFVEARAWASWCALKKQLSGLVGSKLVSLPPDWRLNKLS